NAVYTAFNTVRSDVAKQPAYEVPLQLRNAPTKLMKSMDYGRDYRYAHDEAEAYAAGENYFPAELDRPQYYFPVGRGLEVKIREKLEHLRELDAQALRQKGAGRSSDRDDH